MSLTLNTSAEDVGLQKYISGEPLSAGAACAGAAACVGVAGAGVGRVPDPVDRVPCAAADEVVRLSTEKRSLNCLSPGSV